MQLQSRLSLGQTFSLCTVIYDHATPTNNRRRRTRPKGKISSSTPTRLFLFSLLLTPHLVNRVAKNRGPLCRKTRTPRGGGLDSWSPSIAAAAAAPPRREETTAADHTHDRAR